jgi:hypothetical protein
MLLTLLYALFCYSNMKLLLLERLIINDEPISNVTIDYTLISLIYFLNRDTFYITTDFVFTAKFKHLQSLFYAADRRSCKAAMTHDQCGNPNWCLFLGNSDHDHSPFYSQQIQVLAPVNFN